MCCELFFRRKIGVFKVEELFLVDFEEKGYRLRDIDDRLIRLKVDIEKTRLVVEMFGVVLYGNGNWIKGS